MVSVSVSVSAVVVYGWNRTASRASYKALAASSAFRTSTSSVPPVKDIPIARATVVDRKSSDDDGTLGPGLEPGHRTKREARAAAASALPIGIHAGLYGRVAVHVVRLGLDYLDYLDYLARMRMRMRMKSRNC